MTDRIRVWYDRSTNRWLIHCEVCEPGLFGWGVVAWSHEWALAVSWAHDHGQEHQRRACPTCGHTQPIPKCGHCGQRVLGNATIANTPVCHPDGFWSDCYHRVTHDGEPLGQRKQQAPA